MEAGTGSVRMREGENGTGAGAKREGEETGTREETGTESD